MIPLSDLDAKFIRYETKIETWDVVDGDPDTWRDRGCPTKPFTGPKTYQNYVDSLAEAQGIWFQCPICRTHYCSVSFADRGVTDEQGSVNSEGKPSRWNVAGTGLQDLTTTPSIALHGGCNWHGYITNGAAGYGSTSVV